MERVKRVREKIASGAVSLVILILFVQTVIFVFTADKYVATTDKYVVDEITGITSGNDPVSGDNSSGYASRDDKEVDDLIADYDRGNNWRTHSEKENNLRIDEREGDDYDCEESVFSFDPNTISQDSLVLLGLSASQANVVVNYRENGGYFSVPDDFRKIYVLPEGFFERVRDSIYINKIELNSAGHDDLVKLPGIGDYYATRILEFRDKLGGFVDVSDLLQVKGIDSLRFELFSQMVYTDVDKIVKRSLDSLKFSDLNSHPEIGPYLARGIVRMRERMEEGVVTVALLVARKIITEERAVKLYRYFR